MSNHRSWEWFKCYPENWLSDTREMTDKQARVYWDFLCVSYQRPGGIVNGDDKWIAHDLRCTWQKWIAVKRYLLRRQLLVTTPCGGIANPRVLAVCGERQARADAHAEAAQERRKSPKLALWKTGGATPSISTCISDSSHASSRPASRVVNPESANEINEGRLQTQTDARARHSFQTEDSKKQTQRTLPSDVVASLVDLVGNERTEGLINDYLRRDANGHSLADSAKNLRNAFIGWLWSQHSIDLAHMKATKNGAPSAKTLAAEIYELTGGNLTLPTDADMAARAKRARQ